MRFSLVVATIGRTAELVRLFESLVRQRHSDFEVIVVDQNEDGRVQAIIESYSARLDIRHLKASPSVSRARNIGLVGINGDLVCFPDDDCWYAPDLLQTVHTAFVENQGWDGVIGDAVDEFGTPTLPWRDRRGPLTPAMSWRRSVTYAYFLRRSVLDRVAGFDETLGPGSGSPWGCGEDNDLMLRVLEAKFRVQYEPDIRIFHPRMFPSHDAATRQKRYRYAIGDGHLLHKHPMPFWWVTLFFAIPACRVVLACLKFRGEEARTHWAAVRGRVQGVCLSRKATQQEISTSTGA